MALKTSLAPSSEPVTPEEDRGARADAYRVTTDKSMDAFEQAFSTFWQGWLDAPHDITRRAAEIDRCHALWKILCVNMQAYIAISVSKGSA